MIQVPSDRPRFRPALLSTLIFCLWSTSAIGQQQRSSDRGGLRWVAGRVIDEYGNTIPSALVSLREGEHTDSTFADGSGRFSVATELPRMSILARKMDDHSLYFIDVFPSHFPVAEGDTLETLLDARGGNFLRVEDQRSVPVGLGREPILVDPGSRVTVRAELRMWVRAMVPQTDVHLVAGIESVPQARHLIGTPGPYPGMTRQAGFSLTAPDVPGSYQVFLCPVYKSDTSRQVLFSFYREAYAEDPDYALLPLGTIVVRGGPDPPAHPD